MDQRATRFQPRYVHEVESERRRNVVGIHNEYMCTLGRPSGIELWWLRGGGIGGYKRKRGFANDNVLMEGDELCVRDDLDFLRAERCELHVLLFRVNSVLTVQLIKIYAHRFQVRWDFS